jgi:hypothetical protein
MKLNTGVVLCLRALNKLASLSNRASLVNGLFAAR